MVSFPSRLGFGVSGVLGTSLVCEHHTLELVHLAYELGVRVFDTAPSYHKAENRLGQALKCLDRDTCFVMTKLGHKPSGLVSSVRDFSPNGIDASLKDSLARLHLDYVNGLTLHGPGPEDMTDILFERLHVLKRAGAFEYLGIAGRGIELDRAFESGQFDYVMMPVHPFLNSDEEARLTRFYEAGWPVIAIETAGDGLAALSIPTQPSTLYKFAKVLRAKLKGQTGRGLIESEYGLKVALARPSIACALTTTSRSEHLRANLAKN